MNRNKRNFPSNPVVLKGEMTEPDKLDEILDKLKKEQWAIAWSPDTQTGTLTAFTEAKAEISKHYIERDKVKQAIHQERDLVFTKDMPQTLAEYTEALVRVREALRKEILERLGL